MALNHEGVLNALRAVLDPDLHTDIVTLGFVKDIEIDGGAVRFKVQLTTPACPVKEQLKTQCEDAVRALGGVTKVEVEMTAQVRERKPTGQELIPGVRHCIAIASGKGGVGKSTVTVNLAAALAATGARVGILDADVYGPSIPMMLDCAAERPLTRDSKILPIERFGIKMMSLGFLLEEGQAVLWRGPMVAATVRQLLEDVDWGELDYLLVDLPPGTGDAPMSLAQLAPLTGVVIVTTPHHVSANIAGKSVLLFRRLKAPILGVVENMADYVCPTCGETHRVFTGYSGGQLAGELKIPYLGSIPLDPMVGQAGDQGRPAVLAYPTTQQAASFRDVAGKLAQQVSIQTLSVPEAADEAPTPTFQPTR